MRSVLRITNARWSKLMSRFTAYQRRLFVLLSAANFFEGYDFFALGQILPNLRAEMGLTQAQGGLLLTIIGVGSVAAYGVVRLADRLGRQLRKRCHGCPDGPGILTKHRI